MGSKEWSIGYGRGQSWLPPGFRFHPTDEELVTCYLAKKVQNDSFTDPAIAEVDFNKCEPWDLPARAKMGEKEWYFYSLLDRKYPTGMRTNRATDAGYWKATGKDREVICSRTNTLVGMKKTLVFYKGRAPKGEKTNWVMHEYRLEGNSNIPRTTKEERVVCRVFQKSFGETKPSSDIRRYYVDYASPSSTSLPPLLEPPHHPLSKGTSPQGEYEAFGNSFSFMRSAAYNSCFAEPSLCHREGESSDFTKFSSSYLQPDLSSNSQTSTTICTVTKGLNNNNNSTPQIAMDALNLDLALPWLSTNLPSNHILKALMDECNSGDGDEKSNLLSRKTQPKVSEGTFLLEDLIHDINSPFTAFQKQQQPQLLEAVPTHVSQEENNLSIHHHGEILQPKVFNNRLIRCTSELDLENFWEY